MQATFSQLYRTPRFPDLPETRMSFGHPFQHIGIDMSGHYTLYNKGVEIKHYVCVLTCLSSCATHALVCRDNSTYAIVYFLRRHIYRYGAPQSILTDNAKNFESTNNILEEHTACMMNACHLVIIELKECYLFHV